jgi:hypothetical protein
MNLWLYSGSGSLRALTNDSEGANLPSDLGPWTLERAVWLQGDAPDEQEAMGLVEQHGYCCFD